MEEEEARSRDRRKEREREKRTEAPRNEGPKGWSCIERDGTKRTSGPGPGSDSERARTKNL